MSGRQRTTAIFREDQEINPSLKDCPRYSYVFTTSPSLHPCHRRPVEYRPESGTSGGSLTAMLQRLLPRCSDLARRPRNFRVSYVASARCRLWCYAICRFPGVERTGATHRYDNSSCITRSFRLSIEFDVAWAWNYAYCSFLDFATVIVDLRIHITHHVIDVSETTSLDLGSATHGAIGKALAHGCKTSCSSWLERPLSSHYEHTVTGD